MQEREYKFWISRGSNHEVTVVKKESELTQEDKDLMLGNIINEFNKCSREIQIEFLNKLVLS